MTIKIVSCVTGLGAMLVVAYFVQLPWRDVRTGGGVEGQRPQEDPNKFSPYVDSKGAISLPEGFRRDWAHMGTVLVAGDRQTGFHDVYTQKSTIEAYRESGKFPDGAVLVKEVRSITSGKLTTGDSSWGGDIDHWFVMVEDRKGRFPDNLIWGDGWGWGLFKADEPQKNTTTNFRVSCLGCHIPAKADDWVYVDSYPTLRKPKSTHGNK